MAVGDGAVDHSSFHIPALNGRLGGDQAARSPRQPKPGGRHGRACVRFLADENVSSADPFSATERVLSVQWVGRPMFY